MIWRKKVPTSLIRIRAQGVGSSSPAQRVISTNVEILCLPPSQPTNPERERQLEGSNEAQKALGACRLCAYLCGTPQRLLHDKVEHTRLATKVTDIRQNPLELGVDMVHVNPYFLSSQLRAAWRALPPLEVSLLPTGHCTSARIRTIRLHGAPQQRLPQCTMCSLSAFLTPAAVCAQINCRLNVM